MPSQTKFKQNGVELKQSGGCRPGAGRPRKQQQEQQQDSQIPLEKKKKLKKNGDPKQSGGRRPNAGRRPKNIVRQYDDPAAVEQQPASDPVVVNVDNVEKKKEKKLKKNGEEKQSGGRRSGAGRPRKTVQQHENPVEVDEADFLGLSPIAATGEEPQGSVDEAPVIPSTRQKRSRGDDNDDQDQDQHHEAAVSEASSTLSWSSPHNTTLPHQTSSTVADDEDDAVPFETNSNSSIPASAPVLSEEESQTTEDQVRVGGPALSTDNKRRNPIVFRRKSKVTPSLESISFPTTQQTEGAAVECEEPGESSYNTVRFGGLNFRVPKRD